MNDLEEAARPYLTSMIQGRGRVLHEAGKETVARWAFKTALMLDLGQEAKFRSIPLDDYVAFYEAEGLLPDTHVWLAGCDFGGGAGARTRTLDFHENGTTITGYGTTIQTRLLGHRDRPGGLGREVVPDRRRPCARARTRLAATEANAMAAAFGSGSAECGLATAVGRAEPDNDGKRSLEAGASGALCTLTQLASE
jgi:hypothetical protein